MRKHHVVAVVVVLLIGLAVKQYFYPPLAADADVSATFTMNVRQMQIDHADLPAQKIHDMSLVFDSE
ncbi:MAG TPA: hypothetical protein VGJ20_40285 [Xanthobacteraceae bacterium]